MSDRKRTRLLAATALVTPILLGLAIGGAYAAENRDAQFYVQSAQRMLQNKDYRGAEIQLRNAAQRAPNDGTIHMQLAEVYLLQGNSSAAEAELTSAKQRGVKDERLAMLLAETMFRNGEYGELLRDVPAANRAPETESVVRTYRGLAQFAVGSNDEARTMLQDAGGWIRNSFPPKSRWRAC